MIKPESYTTYKLILKKTTWDCGNWLKFHSQFYSYFLRSNQLIFPRFKIWSPSDTLPAMSSSVPPWFFSVRTEVCESTWPMWTTPLTGSSPHCSLAVALVSWSRSANAKLLPLVSKVQLFFNQQKNMQMVSNMYDRISLNYDHTKVIITWDYSFYFDLKSHVVTCERVCKHI